MILCNHLFFLSWIQLLESELHGGVRGVASQERLSEVIVELPFFFFVPFSPLLSISSYVSLTIIYMSVLSALLFAAHTHTHTHTYTQLTFLLQT